LVRQEAQRVIAAGIPPTEVSRTWKKRRRDALMIQEKLLRCLIPLFWAAFVMVGDGGDLQTS
jgi:CHAT domain-containing protein